MRIAAVAGAAALLVAGGLYAWMGGGPATPKGGQDPPILRVSSEALGRTVVAATDHAPIPEGRNVLWCASFQLAWDAFRRDLCDGQAVDLGPSAPAADVAALNDDPFPPGDLDSRAFVAVAGAIGDGILDRFREAARTRLGENAPGLDLPQLAPHDHAAFAMLVKHLAFEPRFERYEGLRFAGGERAVRAFGLNSHTSRPDKRELLDHVRIHLAEASGRRTRPERFILEIPVAGGGDRLLLARIDPAPTLRGTWEKVREAAQGEGEAAESGAVLAVPMLNFDLSHRFRDLEGPLPALAAALQRTRFRLDEAGATLWSVAAVAREAIDPYFLFDRPSLVALLQKGATRPYFLLWIANDELLVPEE